MSTKSTKSHGKHRTRGTSSSNQFVLLGTQVPREVKKHYTDAAARHGVSLSRYFERLAAVDPIAYQVPEDSAEETKAEVRKESDPENT